MILRHKGKFVPMSIFLENAQIWQELFTSNYPEFEFNLLVKFKFNLKIDQITGKATIFSFAMASALFKNDSKHG